MSGKGSNRRKGDDAVAYRENHDRIFGNKDKKSFEFKLNDKAERTHNKDHK
jgi:hypothetical protein